MYAAAYGEHQSVLHLVEFQATWGLQERLYGRNFLDYAIRRRHMKVIESLIDWLGEAGDHGTASEVLDHCIAYCIVQCNDHYDTTIPHRLFELGADADTIVNRRTLMHLATTSKMSQLIMKKNFTLFHSRDDSGKTALMQVANLVDANTLTTVASQEQAADFNAQDARGKTALHYLLRSRYVKGIYDNYGTDKSWQIKRHRNMISCLNTLLQQVDSVSTADNCVCACSEDGCTALTFALNRLDHSITFGNIDCGIVFDLFQAARHQSDPDDLSKWSSAIRRYHTFEEKGLTHTCCRARDSNATILSCRLKPDTFTGARAEQIQAMADFNTKSSGNVCTDDDIISSLATLCLLYEQQSIAKHGSIVSRREPKANHLDAPVTPLQQVIRPIWQSNPCTSQLHVDYNKDEIKHRFGFEFAPPICEVTIDCYKGWLRWCDRNFVKLDIKGGRRNYTEYGWHLVSMFEDKVEELRSSTETWYTAPEQTAETP